MFKLLSANFLHNSKSLSHLFLDQNIEASMDFDLSVYQSIY